MKARSEEARDRIADSDASHEQGGKANQANELGQPIEPEAENVVHRESYLGVEPVQVGLFREEGVEVILPGSRIERPGRRYDDVADRIHARLHAGFAHPAEHQLVRRAVLAREEHARQSARKLRMAGKRVAALHDAFGGQHGRIVYFVRDARRAEPPWRRRVRRRARRRVRAFAVGSRPRL